MVDSVTGRPSDAVYSVSSDEYTFEEMDVTFVVGMRSGAVVNAAGVWITPTNEADAVAVVCDAQADYGELTAGVVKLRCAVRDAIAMRGKLKGNGAIDTAAVETALKAKGIVYKDTAA